MVDIEGYNQELSNCGYHPTEKVLNSHIPDWDPVGQISYSHLGRDHLVGLIK